ncbi:50S ribosomal protein L22 [Desulfovibrio sp. OttesenSCG-928-G15]|nr:50S ribosomal protein L22 [Desulfovibrio sp. OttesenSCG-928-G15]
METRASLKAVRLSPRKARLVARNVVGMDAAKALDVLKFTPQKAAAVIRQVMYSALSNSNNNTSIDPDTLVVKQIIVNEGPSWKRFLPRAQGRATSIVKRTSHITVILAENN